MIENAKKFLTHSFDSTEQRIPIEKFDFSRSRLPREQNVMVQYVKMTKYFAGHRVRGGGGGLSMVRRCGLAGSTFSERSRSLRARTKGAEGRAAEVGREYFYNICLCSSRTTGFLLLAA